MSLFEAYLFLFFDSIMSSMILVPNSVMVFKLMEVFGGYNHALMIIIAIAGSGIGASINYILGTVLHSLKQKVDHYKDSEKFISLAEYSNKRLFVLCIFSFLKLFGVIFTTAAGFLGINYKRFILLVLAGQCLYYIFII